MTRRRRGMWRERTDRRAKIWTNRIGNFATPRETTSSAVEWLRIPAIYVAILSCLPLTAMFAQGSARAQTTSYGYEWAMAISGPLEGDFGQSMAISPDGSVYVGGSHGGLDLDRDGEVDVPAMSCGGPCPRASMDPLLTKFSPDGELLWLRSPDGPETDWGSMVATDANGGVYLIGVFRETLTFESGKSLESNGKSDGFVAHYDADGNLRWATAIGGEEGDGVIAVGVDAAGNIYVSATVREAVDVDGDRSPDLETSGDATPLIASFTADGRLRWARTVETPTSSSGGHLAVSPNGGIYLRGWYSGGTIDFDQDGQADLPQAGEELQPFLVRFEPDGEFSWARPIRAGYLAIAGNGDVIVIGRLGAPFDLDGDGTADADPVAGDQGVSYLARFSPEGALLWVRTFHDLMPWHVATDGDRFVVSGFYEGGLDLDFDGTPEGDADPDGREEGVLTVFSADGEPEHTFTVVGPGADQIRAAGFSPDRTRLYATGFVRLTADFDADGVVEGGVRCDAKGDLFVSRYLVDAP